jgi:hypothetical protein
MSIQYEWTLNPAIFRYIDLLWGPHSIDRFASISTTQLPQYNSRFFDPLTQGVDALAQQNWADHNNYVNPPFRLLSRVLQVIKDQKAWATVIAPYWPSQHWFNSLQGMLVAAPFRIPNSPHSMWRMGDMAEPLKNHHWRIFAWRIYGGTN